MNEDKQKQEISVIGRFFSMEAILILAGVVFLVNGISRQDWMSLFWGVMIIGGSITLYFVRKKDWKKHWEEQEATQRRYEARRKLEQEGKDGK